MQERLSWRQGKLARYRYAAKIDQPNQPLVSFEFAFLAPGRMRGHFYKPQDETVSFDGQSAYQLLPAQHLFRTLEFPRSPAARETQLYARFSPFIVEGFLMPSMPSRVQVSVVAHPKAPEAVAIKADVQDERGNPITVTYTLRWPGADFLVKRVEGKDGTQEIRMEEEQCERQLEMCFPTRMTEYRNSKAVKTTQLLELELGESPPQEDFTLHAPAGFKTEDGKL